MGRKYFNFREVFGYGWRVMKANFWFFTGILFLWLTITKLPDLGRVIVSLMSLDERLLVILVFSIIGVGWLINIILDIGLTKIALSFCYEERKPTFGMLFQPWGCFWRFVGVVILYKLIVIAGLLLLIVPGIIWSIKFCLCEYFVVDKGLGPIQALRASSRATMGGKWRLFGFVILCALIGLLGLICLFVGIFVAYPIILAADALVYRKLSEQTPELAELGVESAPRFEITPGRLKAKSPVLTGAIVTVVFILAIAGFVVLWRLDAPAIENDYTVADLRSAPPDCAQSYELLKSLKVEDANAPGAPAIGPSAEDVNVIKKVKAVFREGDYLEIVRVLEENAEGINRAWANAKKGRDVISELATFSEIADLTELDYEADIGFLSNLRKIVYLYRGYTSLQSVQGNNQVAIKELITMDSVFRKLSVDARSILTKLVCISCLTYNIDTANFIVNNLKTSEEYLELLAEHFEPFTEEQTSLRNALIGEYLMFKNAFDNDTVMSYACSEAPKQTRFLYELGYKLTVKRNATLRLFRNYLNKWIEKEPGVDKNKVGEVSIWPTIFPDLPLVPIEPYVFRPKDYMYYVYNPGWLSASLMVPAFERVDEIRTKLQIYDDLLQIVLNKRLGNEISLKARAYSDEYIIDTEKNRIFSPGPDGKPNTDDDIKLIINPEVLGL